MFFWDTLYIKIGINYTIQCVLDLNHCLPLLTLQALEIPYNLKDNQLNSVNRKTRTKNLTINDCYLKKIIFLDILPISVILKLYTFTKRRFWQKKILMNK